MIERVIELFTDEECFEMIVSWHSQRITISEFGEITGWERDEAKKLLAKGLKYMEENNIRMDIV